jgi:acyl-coenzyme A synthetase/AMP-(fatty) acid ligase
MAREYFNDVNQTARSFVGDWFVSGDLGLIDLDDNLVLLGRSTDLVNAGGLKINPVFVETKLRTLEGVMDCAGIEVSSVKGITEFAVAVVGQEQLDLVRLSNLLKSYFPRTHPTVYAQIEAIPRNQNGKVDRSKLRSWFEQKRI